MKYRVKYTDNTGVDNRVIEFETEEEAEKFIEEELNIRKELNRDYEYAYADFGTQTEFWVCGDVVYATWKRLWL